MWVCSLDFTHDRDDLSLGKNVRYTSYHLLKIKSHLPKDRKMAMYMELSVCGDILFIGVNSHSANLLVEPFVPAGLHGDTNEGFAC